MAENTEKNSISPSDQNDSKNSFGEDERIPRLVRISSLHPNYVRHNTSLAVSPIKLLLEDDLMTMTKDWSQVEINDERRLVRFKFRRETPTDYWVTFEAVRKQDFTHEQPIISCIFWREKNIHIATSVDIILILEYLVEQSFTIEEKNRIRRNLQSLKPYTVSRSNKSCQRFFNVLMNMEDPRPRNIEKDLKVFKWSDLFNAFNKVISKYSTNTPKHVVLGDNSIVHSKSLPAHGGADILGANDSGISKSHSADVLTSSSKNNEMSSFLPNERLKILKRKVTQSRNLNQLNINGRHKLFHHAITPTDPIPIMHEAGKPRGDSNFDKEKSFDSDKNKNADNCNINAKDNDSKKSENEYLTESEPLIKMHTCMTGEKLPDNLGSHSFSGSELNSRLNSYSSAPPSISPISDSSNSNFSNNNNNNNNTSLTNESSSAHSSNVFTNDSSRSTQLSLDLPYLNSIGANVRKKASSDQMIDNMSKPLNNSRAQQELYSKNPHTHYFQYPSKSQLYNNDEPKKLSTNNVRIHDEDTADIKIEKVKLPPIEPGINNLNALGGLKIELPPIASLNGSQYQFSGPLPGPREIQSNIEEYRKQPNTVTQQVDPGIEGSTVHLKAINDLFWHPKQK